MKINSYTSKQINKINPRENISPGQNLSKGRWEGFLVSNFSTH